MSLRPNHNAHKPVLKLLSDFPELRQKEDLNSPSWGAQDKDKDKDKDKEERGPVFDLETIFRAYPVRPNTEKAAGLRSLARQILTLDAYRECLHAAENYSKYVKANGIEPKFVKQFKTWCGSLEKPNWREWVAVEPTPASGSPDIVER